MASRRNSQIREIDLSKCGLQQLTQLKQQLDQELAMFQESLQTLKVALTKYQDSKDSLEPINKTLEDKPILVPLTSSIYVPGMMMDCEKVIIDVGTGYYVEKDIDGAKNYFKRKIDFITEQIEKLQSVMIEKAKIRESVMDCMEAQLQAQLGAQMAAANQLAVAKT